MDTMREFNIGRHRVAGESLSRESAKEFLELTFVSGLVLDIISALREEAYPGESTVFRDVGVTTGFFSPLNREFALTVIAAVRALADVLRSDAIVTFARVRKNFKPKRRQRLNGLFNDSVHQALSRAVLDSGVVFVAVMLLSGGEEWRGFLFLFALPVAALAGGKALMPAGGSPLLWRQP
jgi:preprotein translocase subunit SecF